MQKGQKPLSIHRISNSQTTDTNMLPIVHILQCEKQRIKHFLLIPV